MKTKLDPDSLEYKFRQALEERFDSRAQAAAYLGIKLHRLDLACQGDLGALTVSDLQQLSPILPAHVRARLARRVFPYL